MSDASGIEDGVSKEDVDNFLADMEDFDPVIPDEVANYYLSRSGFVCPDIRVQRAISLAAQQFISDIAETAVQLNDVQKASKKKKGEKKVLRMDTLSEVLKEYGISIQKPPYFADTLTAGTKTKMTGKRKRSEK